MTPSDESGGRGVRGILNDLLGRDDEPHEDDPPPGTGEGTDREPGRYGASHPGGPQDEQPTGPEDAHDARRPRPGPSDAGAHRLAEPADEGRDGSLFHSRDGEGYGGRAPTFGRRSTDAAAGSWAGTEPHAQPAREGWSRPDAAPATGRPGGHDDPAAATDPAGAAGSHRSDAEGGTAPGEHAPGRGAALAAGAGAVAAAGVAAVAGQGRSPEDRADRHRDGGLPRADDGADERRSGPVGTTGAPGDPGSATPVAPAPGGLAPGGRGSADPTPAGAAHGGHTTGGHTSGAAPAAGGVDSGALGSDGSTPTSPSGSPTPGDATPGGPASGGPTSGDPTPGHPASGGPASGSPTSARFASGSATTGSPTSGSPTSGGPTSGSPASGSTASDGATPDTAAGGVGPGTPGSGGPASADPASGGAASGTPASAGSGSAAGGIGRGPAAASGTAAGGTVAPGRAPTPATTGAARERLVPVERAQALSARWDAVKGSFVDEPRDAVRQADGLVGELLDELDRLFRDQRRELEHGLDNDDTTTEDLRLALRRYRSFFDRLIDL